ncbi:xk-related protein [Holotrichia oblita]|uniref:Xk-related protein n=1 Tax=Holotrichia oblita TaxID=644536 RepID=A0ACB9TLB1_HOLOL|nr:xk-related protein [Holotrichia oblita]
MPFTLQQDTFIVIAHFRSATLTENGYWEYPLPSCFHQFHNEYHDVMGALPTAFLQNVTGLWYIVDHDDPSLGKIALWQWIIRIVFLLLQISPLLRYLDTLIYGLKSSIAKRTASLDQWQVVYYRRMLDEDTNGALLRLFHCFLHAAPQAIIQLTLLIRTIATAEKRANLDTGK